MTAQPSVMHPGAAAKVEPGTQRPMNITVDVDASHILGDYQPIWNNFGADEPNYSYTPNGSALLRELAALDPSTIVTFRPHNLLTTGDGSGSLKWGSTNVYTEAPDGSPIYDWTITDRLFDNLRDTHVRPLVEIGFMPEALSTHAHPYRHDFPTAPDIFTGWSYPPADYAKWRALIVAWVTHLHQRYGDAVSQWQWEVWNEPDIPYFHGTPEEYFRLYDITVAAVREVLPQAQVGGPAVTGGGRNKDFLRKFLGHCSRGVNADTHGTGAPLSFISFHPKGSPKFLPATLEEPAHVRMNLARQLQQTDEGFQTVASFLEYRRTPVLLTETDPEGCAACQGPQNAYRNGPLYGVSVAEMLVRSAELARLRGVNLQGAVTWAFEFEAQPAFAGFRELATSTGAGVIDKPVLNVFRLFAKLHGKQLDLESSAALPLERLVANGASASPDVDGLATRDDHSINILLWNYHDDDLPAPPASIRLRLSHLPERKLRISRYAVSATEANAYAAWVTMGSPAHPKAAQVAALQKAALLVGSPEDTLRTRYQSAEWTASLPRQGVVLFHITW